MDPDADVGFLSMSPASAEQVTVQIRTVLDRAWEFIALAYKGRAFVALGYPNWDAYVDARFGDLRIAVPREHRTQVVAELAGVRMSCRAIAKVLGVGVATVHRELTRSSPSGPSGTPASDAHDVVVGRDGKEYPRTRRTDPPVVMPCSTCGEHHPESVRRLSVGPVRARAGAASARRIDAGSEPRRRGHLRHAAPARSRRGGTGPGEHRDPAVPAGDRCDTRRHRSRRQRFSSL